MGNCVEKEEIDAPADFEPKASQTSPYLTTPISILIGPKKARYTVPRAFLSESPQWSSLYALDSKSRDYQDIHPRIALPEVNEDVGHTIVHYLYTGTFQKLQSPEGDDLKAELKKNVHLYGVAAKYGLSGLKGLALEKIQNNEGLGGIFDILETIKDASKTLLKDNLGLKPYIERELKAAFESDDTLFGKERFIELFGEAKQFDRILMRIVADIYSEKIAQISQNTPAVINGSSVEAIFTTGTSSPCPLLREEPATEKHEEPGGYGELYEYEKLEKVSECEEPVTFKEFVDKLDLSGEYPVRYSALEKEPYKDLAVNEANVSKEYTYTVRKRVPTLEKETSGKSEERISESNPWDHPLHPDQDLSGESLSVSIQGPIEEDFLRPGVIEELEELEDRKISAQSTFWRDPVVPYNEAPPPIEVERSLWDFTSYKVVCGEAVSRAEAATIEKAALFQGDTPAEAVFIEKAAPLAEKAPAAEEAPVELDKSAQKQKKRKVFKEKKDRKVKMTNDPEMEAPAEVAPNAEPAPCADSAPSAEPPPCVAPEEPALCVEPTPCVGEAPGIEAALQEDILPKEKGKGKRKSKKEAKKAKGSIIIKKTTESPIIPDPVVPGPSTMTSGEIVDERPAPIIIAEEEAARTENNGVDLRKLHHPDDESSSSSSICASRATHLLVDDEWKKCLKCRALIRHLSLELARNMNEDKNGYEII